MANQNQTKKHRIVNKKVIVAFTIFAPDLILSFHEIATQFVQIRSFVQCRPHGYIVKILFY